MNKSKTLSIFAIALLLVSSVNVAFAVDTLDIWTDRSTYELGEDVEIGGITDPSANISLSIVFNDTLVVFIEADLVADENGTIEAEYNTQNFTPGVYNVTVSANGTEAETWFTVYAEPEDPEPEEPEVEPLAVESAESIYYPGEVVEISGEAAPQANVTVTVVFNATTTLLAEDLAADDDGKFQTSLQLSETAPEGLYDITAVSSEAEASAVFSVVASPVDDDGDGDDDDDDGGPDGEGLENAIERARLYLEKVRETLDRLAEEYENNTAVMEYIAKAEEALLVAEGHLDDAAAALEEGDLNTAARHLAAARQIMGRLRGIVTSVIKRHKTAKAERFMEQAQERFQGLRAKIESLEGNVTLAGAQKVKEALTHAAGRMNGFKNRLSNETVNDVLEDLQSLVDEVDDEIDDIDGEEVSRAIKGANALEARLNVLRRTQARLIKKYGNATEVNGDLEDVEGLLEEILERVRAGRPENAGNVLKEAKKLAQDAQKKYREAVKEQAKTKQTGRGNSNSRGKSKRP